MLFKTKQYIKMHVHRGDSRTHIKKTALCVAIGAHTLTKVIFIRTISANIGDNNDDDDNDNNAEY